MHKVVVLGAGRIGASIASLLHSVGRYQVTVVDKSSAMLPTLAPTLQGTFQSLDVADAAKLLPLLQAHDAVLSACSFPLNRTIAEVALCAGCSYFDLTEDVQCTRTIRGLAGNAKQGQIFMPQCGLAPGFIGILGYDLVRRFERLFTLKMRVGALPEFPTNQMMYNLTWSTDGLINEYCNPCEAIKNGRYTEVLPLEGLENFSLDGVEYEAFNTSGGLGTLCETLQDQVEDLTYKTIRYPGHRYLMDFLVNGLRLGKAKKRREMLKDIFESAIAVTNQDLVLIMANATGLMDGRLTEVTEVRKIYHSELVGQVASAIQISTASAACVVMDLFFERELPQQGFVKQEDVALDVFMRNPFATPFQAGSR